MKITDNKSVEISPDMYGIFFEDINYSLDGGLYAEMLENRNFEAVHAFGKKDDFHTVYDGGYAWSVYEDEGAGSYMEMHSEHPVNQINPHYLIFWGKGEKPSFSNKAYDGIYTETGKQYVVSFYAKAMEGTRQVEISLRKYGETVASHVVTLEGNDWNKYSLTLTAEKQIKQGDFVVSLMGEGVVAFDFFSMMPEDAVLGIFRRDLTERLKDLNPSFIRFPGGCIVEGNTLNNRYQWKDTIAPVEERKFNWNRWSVHNSHEFNGFSGPYSHYGQTYGVGYYEYFLLCEYLGAAPLPVINVGLACQFASSEKVDIESQEMRDFIQDALDLIEFANGTTDTEWGKKRAEMGHPEPFGLEYLGIGNEQWQTESVNFFGRYEMFEKVIHETYPQMKLIGSAGADVWSCGYHQAWDWVKKTSKENHNLMYAIDEHYYVAPEWLYDHVDFYDHYDRNVKVFAGEYACHIPGRAGRMNCPQANTLEAAIAEAAFMTGLERNADVVVLASYAPLFARMGYVQWSPNLIWFNGESSFVTPSYYVQQLYSIFRGVRTLSVEGDTEGVYASAVEDQEGRLILKLVHSGEEEKMISLEQRLVKPGMSYTMHYICGDKELQNTMEQKENVAILVKRGKLEENHVTIPANSFCVLVFDRE